MKEKKICTQNVMEWKKGEIVWRISTWYFMVGKKEQNKNKKWLHNVF